MPTETGIFTQEEANTGHLFSYRLAEFIGDLLVNAFKTKTDINPNQEKEVLREHYNVNERIFDFGCGPGTYCKYFEDRGFQDVIGIEGLHLNNFELCSHIKIYDLSSPFALMLPDEEHLKGNVISIEVGEHIPREFEKTFIDNLVYHAKKNRYIIVSWAHEGQPGYGHVNCRPDWHIKKEFEKRGCKYQSKLTELIRKAPEGHVAYLRENLFVFIKS